MGEYIPAGIQFGGRLPEAKVDELISLLNDKSLYENTIEQAEPSRENLGNEFCTDGVNYGLLDELLDFAHKNGLDYIYWHDSGYDWTPHRYRYYASGRRFYELPMLHDGNLTVPVNLIRQLGSFEQVMDYVLQTQADPMPLEIVS